VLAYVRGEASSRRHEILADFRTNGEILELFERATEVLTE